MKYPTKPIASPLERKEPFAMELPGLQDARRRLKEQVGVWRVVTISRLFRA